MSPNEKREIDWLTLKVFAVLIVAAMAFAEVNELVERWVR